MITKFVAKGIVGLPDCDIDFDDSKIILIQGPNGSGKTSLLKRITHPYRSINNRSVELRADEVEGWIESYIRYNNTDYLIKHTIVKRKQKDGFNYLNKSYLMKKIDGDYVHLVDDGGIAKFSEKVKQEFKFYPDYYEILNIGVNNFGIVQMTNSERLATMKKLLQFDVVEEMTKNVSEKTNVLRIELDIYNKELKTFQEIDTMTTELSNKRDQLKLLKVDESKLKSQLGLIIVDEDLIHSKEEELRIKQENVNIMKKIIMILKEYASMESFDYLNETILTRYIEDGTSLNNCIDEIESTRNYIEEAKRSSPDTLLKEKEELMKEYNNIHTLTEYDKYSDVDTEAIKKYLNNVDNKIEMMAYSIAGTYRVEDIESHDCYHSLINELMYDGVERSIYNTYVNTLNTAKNDIIECDNKLQDLTYQQNIVSLTPHPMTPKECPLYIEWYRQTQNRIAYTDTMNIREKAEATINDNEYKVNTLKVVLDTVDNIRSIPKPSGSELILSTGYKFVKDMLKIKELISIIELNKNTINRKNLIQEKIDNIDVKLELVNTTTNKAISSMEDKLAKLLERKRVLQDNYNSSKEYYNRLHKFSATLNNKTYTNERYADLVELERRSSDIIDKENNELNELIKLANKQEQIKERLNNMSSNIISLSEEVAVLEYKIKEHNEKKKKKEELEDKYVKSKNVVSILRTHLVLKMLKPYLKSIENVVNDLLYGFLTISFHLDGGSLDILCERDGIIRDSSVLSSGESSMLSIALMMALKKSIPWDIISIDEGSAMLDEHNKDKFIYVLRDYARSIPSISQMFLVSHDNVIDKGMDIMILQIKDGRIDVKGRKDMI